MNSYLYIKIKDKNKEKIILKMRQINVALYEIKADGNNLILKIKEEDYEKIRKYLKTLKVTKLKYTGLRYIKESLKRYRLIFLFMFGSFLLTVASSFFIVDIKIVHDDEEIVSMLLMELEEKGIKKFSFKKSYNEIEKIKKEIKDNHLDKIDWLEISKVGMRYIVRIEERIITPEKIREDYCHVYASKDGLVKKMKIFSGESAVLINDYVKKGDLLISGDIHLNNETVNKTCAYGEVMAEVWYTVNVKVPLKYKEETKTGKKRNNLIINYDGIDHVLLKDRLKDYTSSKKLLFDALGVKVYLRKDEEVEGKVLKYSQDEAEQKALEMAKKKIELTLGDNDKILSQKVLQKTVNDSTIDIDIFIVAEENIAAQIAGEDGDSSDT